jgi:hypothetical protein
MALFNRSLLLLLCAALGACAAQAHPPAAAQPATFAAVLIAGDGSLPVFDNAVVGMRARLLAGGGSTRGDIERLSGSPRLVAKHLVRSATLPHILAAVGALDPRPGQGCLVFATSHGGKNEGLWLSEGEDFLTPEALDHALLRGCGSAPTAVVISSCFSGSFAQPPMTRPNRIVLTAARPDRTSFGCRAGRTYTVYDQCLLGAFDAGGTWQQAFAAVKACVAAEEARDDVTPSEPQAWFGADVASMALPVRGPVR